MSAITLTIESQLARTVAMTQRLKSKRRRSRLIAQTFNGLDFFARGVFHVWRNRQYLSTIKLVNMALVNAQFRLKSEYVLGRPYKMKIESTNICNTKCQLCPTGQGLQGREKGKMSLDQYRKLIDQLKHYLVALDLSMWGDPLIVPEIFDMVRYAHDRGIWTYISSNLHAFKPEKDHAQKLVESGLDLLTCSLHGATQKTFEIYQPGKSFGDTVEKVRHILAVRDRMGSKSPQVQLNFVVTKYNEHEIEAFKQLAGELGCKAVFSWASLNLRFLDKDKQLHSLNLAPDVLKARQREHVEKWLPKDRQYVLDIYDKLMDGTIDQGDFNGHKIYNCSWPWIQSVINWDGSVSTCCGSFELEHDMGSVFDTPFARIWNSEKYRKARRSFKNKLDAAESKDNPCAECPGFMI